MAQANQGVIDTLIDTGTSMIDKGVDIIGSVSTHALGGADDVNTRLVTIEAGTVSLLKAEGQLTIAQLQGLIKDLNGHLRDALKDAL